MKPENQPEFNISGPNIFGKCIGENWLIELSQDGSFATSSRLGRTPIDFSCNYTAIISSILGYDLKFMSSDRAITLRGVPKKIAIAVQALISSSRKSSHAMEVKEIDEKLNLAWLSFCSDHEIESDKYIKKEIFDTNIKDFISSSKRDYQIIQNLCKNELGQRSLPKAANRLKNLSYDAHSVRRNINEKRLAKLRSQYEELFSKADLELTSEQAFAALTMEKANLLEAGAGSGKTIVIVARALYAVHSGIAKPSEVLCLAYNHDAAKEIKERIKKAFNLAGLAGADLISVQTFHSFGLSIIQSAYEESKREIVNLISPEENSTAYDEFEYAVKLIKKMPKFDRLFAALLEDTIESSRRLKKINRENVDVKSCELKLMKRLITSEAAYHSSSAKYFRKDLDQDIIDNCEVWGIKSYQGNDFLGYSEFIHRVSSLYRKNLRGSGYCDFSDMTVNATEIVEKVASESHESFPGDSVFRYKFIMIDEFQDISFDRAELVRQYSTLNTETIIFGVGDDWQAINRFSGSDISIFTDFENFFGDTDRRMLTATFRSCRGIAKCAREFVIRNPIQSKKNITRVADESIKDSILFKSYGSKNEIESKIERIISSWVSKTDKSNPKILILDRNKLEKSRSINKSLFNKVKQKFNGLADISFCTAHSSKGLEADYVIITSLIEGVFPSKMKKEFTSELFMPREEVTIDFADERRLFYVALTRAKKSVALLYPVQGTSSFVTELKNIYSNYD